MRDGHCFKITMGLGEGSNNFAELLSLKLLLIFAAKKWCRTLVCFGDSMNVINWVKKTQVCRNLRLENILISIVDLIDTFDSFSCSRVYKENNREADLASKEGLLMMERQWKIWEKLDDIEQTYYHCPFIEGVTPP